jgi:hypothetical protein
MVGAGEQQHAVRCRASGEIVDVSAEALHGAVDVAWEPGGVAVAEPEVTREHRGPVG